MEKPKSSSQFVNSLLTWFEQSHRPMPWKGIDDPYLIWLSEIILQQTRVNQGWDYYLRFKERFPDIKTLANSNVEEVLKYWEGLGYYIRARNLHASAKIILEKYNGKFPDKYEDILALKGIGKYTAAAISSFAFSKAYAVLDGNVYRVLSRILNNSTPIDSFEGKSLFENFANDFIKFSKDPGNYNQAIMDFGATVCNPVNPDCISCPMTSICLAKKYGTVGLLPIKSKRIVRRIRYFHYYIIKQDSHVYIQQRNRKDIWNLLFQFPIIESNDEHEPDRSVIFKDNKSIIQFTKVEKTYKQNLTHQKIIVNFYNAKVNDGFKVPDNEDWIKIEFKNLSNFAFPRIINDYLELQVLSIDN